MKKVVGSTATNFLYQGPDVYAEYGASFTSPAALYTHGPGSDDPILRQTGMGPTATAKYYHQDGLGSIIAFSTQTGTTEATQRFDAWGNKTASSGTVSQYGYTGREPDATGFVYYRARYYDPSMGRFTQRDPSGLRGGINAYAYVNGNPINFNDPQGLVANAALGWVQESGKSYYEDFAKGYSESGQYRSVMEPDPSALEIAGGFVGGMATGLYNMIPGASMMNDATASYQEGNYGMAAVFAIGSLVDASVGVLSGGESVILKGEIGATGILGENALKSLGCQSQVYYKTSQGGRYIDQLVDGVANESKVGYTSLTSNVRQQISKDVELMSTGQIEGANWHFFSIPVTGVGGPSKTLQNALQQNNINVIIH